MGSSYSSFAIEALEDGLTVTFSNNNYLNYKIEGGTWTPLPYNTATPSINAGQRIYFKTQVQRTVSTNGIGTFSINKRCNIVGKINDLFPMWDFPQDGGSRVFYRLFYNCNKIVKVDNDLLKDIALSKESFEEMFYGCSSMINAPELYAQVSVEGCYKAMLKNCSSLQTLKMHLKDISATDCVTNMLENAGVGDGKTLTVYVTNEVYSIRSEFSSKAKITSSTSDVVTITKM